MNSLILLLVALVVFGLGYRYYAKLLAVDVFRLRGLSNDTPAAQAAAPPVNRHVVFAQHFAAVAAGGTLIGVASAMTWGWVPVFLWVVVGTAAAGGTFGLGALWLSRREPGPGIGALVGRELGGGAGTLATALAFLLLLMLNAGCAALIARLFVGYPSSVLPFWLLIPLAFAWRGLLRGQQTREILPVSIGMLITGLIVIALAGRYPLGISGALNLDVLGQTRISLDATVAWVILLLVYGDLSARLPLERLARPRAYGAALLAGVLGVLFLAGMVLLHPALAWPEFHRAADLPGTLPALFLTVTGGAVAGLHWLMADGVTARQLPRDTDARYVGYGAALAQGGLAVCVLTAVASGGDAAMTTLHDGWQGGGALAAVLGLVVNGLARAVSALGLGAERAQTLTAVTLAGLLSVGLEFGLRLQRGLLRDLGQRYHWDRLQQGRRPMALTAGLAGLLALADGQGTGGLVAWPGYGPVNLMLAVLGLMLMTRALRQKRRPLLLVAVPAVVLGGIMLWALVAQLIASWAAGHAGRALTMAALLAAGAWLAGRGTRTGQRTTADSDA